MDTCFISLGIFFLKMFTNTTADDLAALYVDYLIITGCVSAAMVLIVVVYICYFKCRHDNMKLQIRRTADRWFEANKQAADQAASNAPTPSYHSPNYQQQTVSNILTDISDITNDTPIDTPDVTVTRYFQTRK